MSRVQRLTLDNHTNDAGQPSGGSVTGLGISIHWQDGPLGENPENGAFVESVLHAAIQRIEYYQTTPLSCPENSYALTALGTAQAWLSRRTDARVARGVKGTHTP